MNFKKWIVLGLVALILLGIFFRVVSLNKDFTGEEMEFLGAAKAIFYTGHPIFYESEQSPMTLALWHPPMYLYLLALVFRFSMGEISVRLINVLLSLATAGIIFLFCRSFLDEGKKTIIGLTASAIFLINYYVLSSSILIDIDMLSTFFTFCFLYFTLLGFRDNRNWIILAGVSFFLGLWNRYPIAIMIYVLVGVYICLNRDLRKYIKKYIVMGLIAFICFVLLWGIYSTFVEPGNFFSFFTHNLEFGAQQLSSAKVYLGSFIINLAQLSRLVTFPILILMIWAGYHFSKRRSAITDLLIIYGASILLLFVIIPRPAFGYPRYFLTMMPAVSVLISLFLFRAFKNLEIKKSLWVLAIFSFIVSMGILMIASPQPTLYSGNGLIKATNLPDFLLNLFALLPLVSPLFIRKLWNKRAVIFILVILALSYSLYFDFIFAGSNSHIKETAAYINERINSSDVIIGPKAVDFYTIGRYYINDNNKPNLEFSLKSIGIYIGNSWANKEMDSEFFWSEGYFGGMYSPVPSNQSLMKAKYAILYHPVNHLTPEKKIGEFYIYRLQ